MVELVVQLLYMVKDKAEEKRKEGLYWIIKRIVAVFATFFVVIGVAVVGLFARDTMPEIVEEISGEATSTAVYEPAFVLAGESSASLHKLDGVYIRDLTWPEDTKIFDKPVSQLRGVDAMNGEDVWMENGFVKSTTTEFRSPDGRREVRLESKRRDGSHPLVVSYGNDDDIRIPRIKGELIREIELIGWSGDKSFVFIGEATGTKAFFILDLGSAIKYYAPAPNVGWGYRILDGEIYFLSSEILDKDGEELRVAPGSINRVSKDGDVRVLVGEADSVVQSFVLDDDKIIYALVDQSMIVRTGKNRKLMGKCLPLFLMDDEVVCRAGDGIEIRSVDKDPHRLFDANDKGVFYLTKVRMDEGAGNGVQ